MLTFVIGDIHGEITKLKQLLYYIDQLASTKHLIFIGDYIDKGENSKLTLDFLLNLQDFNYCTFLLGNHEYMWLNFEHPDLNAYNYLKKYGGMRTAFSFGNDDLKFTKKKILEEYNAFFKILKPYHLVDNYFICHSGIPTDFLHHKPTQIPVNKFLFNRYDFISNQKLYLNTYKVIFGHTGFYSPYVDNFKIGIDTSACFLEEQPLTAFCIEERIFINSNNYITELSTISVDYCPNIPRIKPWRT